MKKLLVALIAFLAFAPVAFAASLGTVSESIPVGKTLSISLGASPSGTWFILNNDSSTASASLSGNTLLVKGVAIGTTSFSLCAEMSAVNCMNVTVRVVGSVLGLYTSNTHPVGSWVLYQGTVYYVHSTGLMPIPTWSIFLSNGGTQKAIVDATEADLNLPLLPLMVAKDSRVK